MTTVVVSSNKAVKLYRGVLILSIVLNMAVGVFILLLPEAFTSMLGQPTATPDTWPRHWGAQLLAINLLYMPGFRDPVGHQWPNWLGIGIRLSFALFFFMQGGGFVPMGIYDGASGLLLLLTYLPVVKNRA